MRPYPLSATDVALSVRGTLAAHLPAVLADSPRPLPAPSSYEQTPTPEAIQRVKGVALAVVVTGTTGSPERFADGEHDLDWSVLVTVWHENTKSTPLLIAAADYAAAIRQTLLAHTPSVAQAVEYGGESQELVSDEVSNRFLGSATTEFTVRTGSFLLYPGNADGELVLTTDVTVTPQPIPSNPS